MKVIRIYFLKLHVVGCTILRRHIILFHEKNQICDSKDFRGWWEVENNSPEICSRGKDVSKRIWADESGFQLEIHSGRSLACEGQKKIECVVQSVSSTTHSYTIQPTVTLIFNRDNYSYRHLSNN